MKYDGQEESEEVDADENGLNINLGVGIDFKVSSSILIFVDGRYVICFTDNDENTNFVPFRAGVSFVL
jgi:hypothetical protein